MDLYDLRCDSLGVGTNYGIIRTLPVDTLGLAKNDVMTLALHEQAVKTRTEIFRRILSYGKTQVILVVGEVAQSAWDAMAQELQANVLVVELDGVANANASQQWQAAVAKKKTELANRLGGNVKNFAGGTADIPRLDFPFHQRIWFGSQGNRALRATEQRSLGKFYRVHAPKWVGKTREPPLTAAEKTKIDAGLLAIF